MSPTIMSGLKPASRIASAPPSTATSTGRTSRTYGRRMRRSFWWSTPRTTTSAGRSRKRVSKSGSSSRPASRSRSSRMCSIVLAANDSIASPIRLRACSWARLTVSMSCTCPSASISPPRSTRRAHHMHRLAVLELSNSAAPGTSTRCTPPSARISGPLFGIAAATMSAPRSRRSGRRRPPDRRPTLGRCPRDRRSRCPPPRAASRAAWCACRVARDPRIRAHGRCARSRTRAGRPFVARGV